MKNGISHLKHTGERMVITIDDTDEQLIKKAVSGNHLAYSALITRYYQKTTWFIHLYIRDQATVKDLTQDVFMSVLLNLKDFRFNSKFSTWLYRVSLNVIKNHLRLIHNRSECTLEFLGEQHPEDRSTEQHVIGVELGEKIEKAFLRLPKTLKQCYTMHTIEGASYQDISIRMHCPIGTVRSRIYRARHLLKLYI